MKKNHIVLLLVILLCLGCSGTRQKVMDTWLGGTKSNLIERWGPPNSTFNYIDDNNISYEVFTYKTYWNDYYGYLHECKTSFYINKNKIERYNYQGCPLF